MDESDKARSVVFSYTNHRGETGIRTAVPIRLRWGTDEWYPEPCWLLDAFDLDKQAERTFALLKMGSLQGSKSDEPLGVVFDRLREASGGRWDEIDDVPAYLGRTEADPRDAQLAALRAEVERLRLCEEALREIERRIRENSKPLREFLNGHQPLPPDVVHAYKWAVYGSCIHAQVFLSQFDRDTVAAGLTPPEADTPR